MGRISKEETWRREGMGYALRIAKEKGIDGLEKELQYRNVTEIPISVSRKVCDDAIRRIKENTIDTVVIMAIATLHDEFGFGQKRVQQFLDRFDKKTACMVDDYVTWDDLREQIKSELDIQLDIRENK